ncbi:MAG: hypothetical protein RIM84_16480 [Alphaproteobacteria bacterium]
MSAELWLLLGAAFWGLVHVGAAAFSYKAQVGNTYAVGARDDDLPLHAAGVRWLRTFAWNIATLGIVVAAGPDRRTATA